MGVQIRHITKMVIILLFFVVLASCGGGGTTTTSYKAINNPSLFTILKDGSPEQSFPGVSSFIDTKVVFQGVDMFLGLTIDAVVKTLITSNVNSFLETATPVFDGGSAPFPVGVTVDAALKKITVALSETRDSQTTADISISWVFAANNIVRSYTKTYIAGELKGSTYTSSWRFTYSSTTELTTAAFTDSVNETKLLASSKTQTKKTAHNGTVIYKRNNSDGTLTNLTSADFSQNHTETNNATARTYTLNGNVKMTGTTATTGNLSFDGGFTFDIPSYQAVSGLITLTNGTYGKGFDNVSNAYYNETNISNSSTLAITSQSDYSATAPASNAASLRGAWLGAFTDNCSTTGSGKLELSITEATATWNGITSDSSRIYGTLIAIDGSGLHLKNNGLSWGDSSKIAGTTIEGAWSSGGCGGTFTVVKQP